MKTLASRESDPDSEGDFPPVLLCAKCGRSACSGCEEKGTSPGPLPEIAFERSASPSSLWQTVLACSIEPEFFFGRRLMGRGLGHALAFAALCEALALGSVFAALGAALVLLLPGALAVLLSPAGLSWGLALWTGSITFLVGVHILWSVALLVGMPSRFQSSTRVVLRFGLYACGWDLVTSPVGVVFLALFRRGPGRFEPIGKAARAPRRAMDALLADCLGLSDEERKRVLRRAGWAAFVGFGLTVLAFGGLIYAWLARTNALAWLQWW